MARLDWFLDILFSRQRWIAHCIFWGLVFIWYSLFFGRQNSNYQQTFFFVGLLMPVTIVTSYFLNYFLVPRYLFREKYGLFMLYFMYTLIGGAFLAFLISVLTLILVAEFNVKNMSPASIDLFFLLTSLLSVVFLTLAIKLMLHWRKSKEDYNRLILERMEGELRFLKAQLNPHFLFNTLNNLYYLTTEKSEVAPAAILQLSGVLDYVLHATKERFVTVEQEWQQAQNYIALELLHYQDRLSIETNISGDTQDRLIPPMILITLLENAFKHGVSQSRGRSWIALNVVCRRDSLEAELRNSIGTGKKAGGGIGLKNLQSQLNLLYPEKHNLEIDGTLTNEFVVKLSLVDNESKVSGGR